MEKENDYTVEELMENDMFRKWTFENDEDAGNYWQVLSRENSRLKENIKVARELLIKLKANHDHNYLVGVERANESFARLESKLGKRSRILKRSWLSIAAGFVLIVTCGILIAYFLQSPKVYETHVGDDLQVDLPDGTLVYMKENSRLEIDKMWRLGNRKIQFDGQAYLIVKKVTQGSKKKKFIVETENFDVEVYGTQFNINTTGENDHVILDEGLVQIKDHNQIKTPLLLNPGERYSFSTGLVESMETIVESEENLSYWRPEVFEFDGLELKEALEKMEVIFDISIRLENEHNRNRIIEKLAVPSDNPQIFVETINLMFDENLTVQEK